MSSGQRVILVAGASSGIRHASAVTLIREGCAVYGADRGVHLMDDLAAAGGHPRHNTIDTVLHRGVVGDVHPNGVTTGG